MKTPMDTLRRELATHDEIEVAALCAALQLLPDNASHGQHLIGLAAAALEGSQPGGEGVTRDTLVRWVTESPSVYAGMAWDPFEGPFAEHVSFVGGGYLMLNGPGDADSVFDTRTILWALLGSKMPLPETAFHHAAADLARAALVLSTHVCEAAGVGRSTRAGSAASVVVPLAEELATLKSAVSFSSSDLEALVGLPADALDPIVHDLDRDGPATGTPQGTQFQARPLVRRGGRYVLVEPNSLSIALRHALVTMALDDGRRSELVEAIGRTGIDSVSEAARQMGWAVSDKVLSPEGPFVSVVAGFDVDKVANIVVLYEDLENYDGNDPQSSWPVQRWETALRRHLRAMEQHLLLGAGDSPNELLHLVVLAGCGRPAAFGLPAAAEPLHAPQLVLTLESLGRIAMVVHDPLRLWNYARARDRLRDTCQVLAFGTLDEFAAWNEHQSYYMSDDTRPTFINFATGYGCAFRETAADSTDVHSVASPHRTWMEVSRVEQDPGIPIYAPFRSGRRPCRLIEDAPVPMWVEAPGEYAKPEHRDLHVQMLDCVAYWLWQLSPSLAPLLQASGVTSLVVDVAVEDPDAWFDDHLVQRAGPVATATSESKGIVHLTVHPSLRSAVDGADNHGERELVRCLLGGLRELNGPGTTLSSDACAAAIERHVPIGPKKMINLLSTSVDPALQGGDLPPFRPVSQAETDLLLNEAGEHLAEAFSLVPGQLPDGKRTEILNGVVAFHFSQLESEVARLSPTGLLEHLVVAYESFLRRDAWQRRTLGARMAAFGETGLAEDLRRSIPEATQTAVALRFLIEYVTAQPPKGNRPISWTVYDRLIAICAQIISRGLTSDLIHLGLEDTQLSFLESGRLGLPDTGAFQTGQRAFLDVFVPAHMEHLAERYSDAWDRPNGSTDGGDGVEEFNTAAEAEWGFTFRELLEAFADLGMAAATRDSAAAHAPVEELVGALAESLGWARDRVRSLLDVLTIRPRPTYLSAPPGFTKHELWPWRYNRQLSYLRRPLLRRATTSGDEYVWGPRHPHLAGRYLFDLITTERLAAQSRQMQNFMTRFRQGEGQALVDAVASFLESRTFRVDTNVRKVAGERITRENGEDLGDIDVLAASRRDKLIYALECKALAGARTPAELANELNKTFRSGDGRGSAAEKHVERLNWLDGRTAQILKHLSINASASGWHVEGAILTDFPTLSPHIGDCPLPVFTFSEFRRIRDAPAG